METLSLIHDHLLSLGLHPVFDSETAALVPYSNTQTVSRSLLGEVVDLVIVVGSQNSSNSNRLREVAELLGTKAYLIDSADQSSIELGPGAIIDLNPGEEVQFADPKHPNTGYDDFTNATIRLIGAGLATAAAPAAWSHHAH